MLIACAQRTGRSHHGSCGLTLIELLMVLSLAAVVLAIGAPALGQWVRDIEVRSSAATLLNALQAARAEALTRNASVRLQLPDAAGRPGWQLTCVQSTARCPLTLRQLVVDTGTAVRWGAARQGATPSFTQAIAAGAEFPASLRFDASGAAPEIAAGAGIARIDVTYDQVPETRRMVVLVSAQGLARICDPVASAGHPQHCH